MPSRTQLPATPIGWFAAGLIAVALALVAYALASHALAQEVGVDAAGYYAAAERLRDGDPLYAAAAANASELYRYAPWFAAAWIPLTFLDRELVVTAWVVLMIGAAAATTVPLLARGWTGLALFAIVAPLQLQGAIFGNVQPLLVLALLWGVERRSGPLWIGLAASLKAVPVLLALVYAGRGEWRRAILAAGLTALLVLPIVLFDLAGYSVEPGPNQMSLAGVWPPAYLAVAGLSIVIALLSARSAYGWLAAAVGMLATLPRLLTYELGFVLIGLARRRTGPDHRPSDSGTGDIGP